MVYCSIKQQILGAKTIWNAWQTENWSFDIGSQRLKRFAKMCKRIFYIPGHSPALHASVSSPAPSHSNPPLAGGGLVQVLIRFLIPPSPQVRLQEPQSLHSVQDPFTVVDFQMRYQWTMNQIKWAGSKFVLILSSDIFVQGCFMISLLVFRSLS